MAIVASKLKFQLWGSETDENSPVIKGKVLAHSLNKEEIYQALESATEEHLAIEYLGQVPEENDLIL